jgi:hypothetical protein
MHRRNHTRVFELWKPCARSGGPGRALRHPGKYADPDRDNSLDDLSLMAVNNEIGSLERESRRGRVDSLGTKLNSKNDEAFLTREAAQMLSGRGNTVVKR